MNRIHDLSQQQLLDLTDEDINRYVDLECAVEGVALLPDLPDAPAAPEAQPDLPVYRVSGFMFMDRDKAEEVAEYLNRQPRMTTTYIKGPHDWRGPETVEPETSPIEVSTSRYWSRSYYQQHAAALDGYRTAKEAWDKKKSEHDCIVEGRKAHEDAVHEIVGRAWDKHHMERNIHATFERYKKLADGDHNTALRFLLDSNRWDVDDVMATVGPWEVQAVEATPE